MIRGRQGGLRAAGVAVLRPVAGHRGAVARAGLAPGTHCVDLGCGGGAVTMEIAGLVGPCASVTGVDMDARARCLAGDGPVLRSQQI